MNCFRFALLSSILTFVLPHTAVAQSVSLSLNLEYTNPESPALGGAWTLVAQTDSDHGISSINAILSNINAAGITAEAGIAAVLDGGSPFVKVSNNNSVEVLYFQDLASPGSVVTNVGRGAGTPGNLPLDFLNDPQWNNSARIFSGIFGDATPAFTTNGDTPPDVTQANVLSTGAPPYTFALPASITTIVRDNLGSLLGDVWDNSSGSGLWSDAANWADDSEPTIQVGATFPIGFPNGDTTITLASEVAKSLTFNDSYTLAGDSLTLPDSAVISVDPGKSAIITSSLILNGALAKAGAGSVTVNHVRATGLAVNAGTVAIAASGTEAATSLVGALSIAGNATPTARIDLNDNAAIVDYTGESPVATVRSQLLAGRGGPGLGQAWDGMGITSSAAANAAEDESRSVGYAENSALPLGAYATFRGQPVDDTSLLMAFTRTGDANLDGVVNDDDVTIVGATYAPGVPQPSWALGDFDYNGFVDDDDVTLIGVFYDPSAPPIGMVPPADGATVSAVPEPSALVLLLIGVLGLSRMRWNNVG